MGFSGGPCREKLNKSTHRMESLKQTAEEIHLKHHWYNPCIKTGERAGSFLHHQSSSFGEYVYVNCVYIYLYNHNSVTLTPSGSPAGVPNAENHRLLPQYERSPNVIHFSTQFADTYSILKTSFCARVFFFFHKVCNKYV